ncbi:MAG: alpha/beta hydrolase-fold protein [Thermoanaerobaculia bacterium]|nr:alpha/beta hydrolase-fold protein [Thermoanaerobaculia bacterium]
MRPLRRLLVLVSFSTLVLVALSPAFARSEREGPAEVSLPGTESVVLESKTVGEAYRIFVAHPMVPPRSPDQKFPTLYLLDGDISFPMVRQIALSLTSGMELPPVLIVGIAYPGGERQAGALRTRDYTPSPDPVFTRIAQRWGGAVEGDAASGGASKFLRFLTTELKPYIEENYPADPQDSTLFGISFGGLFATYALLETPGEFQRFVIGSPSLWWGDKQMFQIEERFAKNHDDLEASVFLAAGGRETAEHDEAILEKLPEPLRRPMLELQEAMDGGPLMLEVVQPFVEQLRGRNYPGLDLTFHVFDHETHGSAPPMIISRGLRVVFDTF